MPKPLCPNCQSFSEPKPRGFHAFDLEDYFNSLQYFLPNFAIYGNVANETFAESPVMREAKKCLSVAYNGALAGLLIGPSDYHTVVC